MSASRKYLREQMRRNAQRYSVQPRLAAVLSYAARMAPRLPNVHVGRMAVRSQRSSST